MNRDEQLSKLRQTPYWDVIIIGGGANGLGTALDSASRGYKTILLEAVDFAKGTSSRSTKLAHGGVRYLKQFDFSMVRDGLRERGLMFRNAGHLVKNQPFIVPVYNSWSNIFYTLGLKFYDLLAGNSSFGSSRSISRSETIALLPTVEQQGLKGGILYHDGLFDDARLAINIAQTAIDKGACLINYMKVTRLLYNEENHISGIEAEDQETFEKYNIKGKVVINATGVFTNNILNLDNTKKHKSIVASQGVHLVFDSSFLPGKNAMMIPETRDGRVLYAIPWHDKVLVGTTDTLIKTPSLEPKALESEIEFLLETAGEYLTQKPKKSDILSIFAGLRPLVASGNGNQQTKELSRSHQIIISETGLISVIGGKWTTYRKIAEDVISKAIQKHHLPNVPSRTETLSIHGNKPTGETERINHLYIYGTDADKITQLLKDEPQLNEKLHPKYPYTLAEVVWTIRSEMARSVEDVLARRLRLLFLDARAALECCEKTAQLLARELKKDDTWKQNQIIAFRKTAEGYLTENYRL